jgi:glutathione synthase/RimK-type ligase-like ATP-grasp enzyme
MKKIAILSNYRDTFSVTEEKKFSYSELTRIFRENWLDLRRVSIHSFDQDKWVFTDYVDIDDNWEFKIFHEEYKPEIVWNRSSEWLLYNHTLLKKFDYKIFPSSYLSTIASDKYEMYCFLKEFQPYTLLLKDFFVYPELRKKLSDRVVLKPIRSNSGKWIVFPTQTELLEKKQSYEGLESLFIVQEFLDFHEWVPWLVEWIHDVRLVYIGWKYSHATIRQPGFGWMHVSWNWREIMLEDMCIPPELIKFANDIVVKLSISEEVIFSLDFGYSLSNYKWFLFELNHSPWVDFLSNDKIQMQVFHQAYFGDLAQYLLR